MVEGALIGTTEFDTFSVDPATCAENWRVHEEYPDYVLPTNRGAAYADGRLFRGTDDGRVLAYDFKTGKRLWETKIADPKKGEVCRRRRSPGRASSSSATPAATSRAARGTCSRSTRRPAKSSGSSISRPKVEGDRFAGLKAPRRSIPRPGKTPGIPISGGGTWTSYTLDTKTRAPLRPGGNPAPDFANSVREGEISITGSVVVLDAKTGDYKNHFKLVPKDWHDWDVSNPPTLIKTTGGKSSWRSRRKTVTFTASILPTTALSTGAGDADRERDGLFAVDKEVHFCPGAVGGAEWNSPAYDPPTNLIFTRDVEWCTTVKLQTQDEIAGCPTRAAVDRRKGFQSVQFVREGNSAPTCLGGMGLRDRRRYGSLEVG